jgi:hypothetical protein
MQVITVNNEAYANATEAAAVGPFLRRGIPRGSRSAGTSQPGRARRAARQATWCVKPLLVRLNSMISERTVVHAKVMRMRTVAGESPAEAPDATVSTGNLISVVGQAGYPAALPAPREYEPARAASERDGAGEADTLRRLLSGRVLGGRVTVRPVSGIAACGTSAERSAEVPRLPRPGSGARVPGLGVAEVLRQLNQELGQASSRA